MREVFVQRLRAWGVEADASSRVTRGRQHRNEQLRQRKARELGRGAERGESAPAKLTPARQEAAQAWCELAKALASSEDPADRRLSQDGINFARWLPGVLYKAPEKQPQRELPGMTRSYDWARERTRGGPER